MGRKGLRRYLVAALVVGWALVGLLWGGVGSVAQEESPSLELPAGYPVVLEDEPLFYIETGVASFPASFRARVVSERLETFAQNPEFELEALEIVENDSTQTVDIRSGADVLVTITAADAAAAGDTQQAIAADYLAMIKATVAEYRRSRSLQNISLGILYAVGLTVIFLLSFWLSNRLIARLNRQFRTWQGSRIRGWRILGTELVPADRVADLLSELLKLIRMVLFLALLVVYISFVLSFFPWTQGASREVFAYLQTAAIALWQSFVSYLPNLFFIGLILVITSYTLRLIKFTFAEIRRGTITLPGFYPEWARPTYNIIRFAILAFAATIVFPYLPGSETPAFQGISIFLGVLFSLGSSGAVANFVAGIILTYSRAFVIGDRVQISETTGDVIEKTLLVTRIATPKNVVVTIPNSMVLGSHIINYSGSIRNEKTPPLVLHTTITLGYDVPWPKVHEVLIAAAIATEHVLTEPAPFVLQTSLDDFYVSYELNVYTEKPSLMPRIYSHLHQNLQDKCNEAGIEILSPHYSAVRDGHQLAVPEKYFPKGYQVPGFRVESLQKNGSGEDEVGGGDGGS